MFEQFFIHERLNELRQRTMLVHARGQARVNRDLEGLHAETSTLRRDTEELALIVRALVTLLADKGVISRDELAGRMVEIDGEDGVEDGRLGTVDQPPADDGS